LQLNKYIEHTLLKVDCVESQIDQLIKEAIRHSFYGVCIPPYYLPLCRRLRQNEEVKLISVVGFPLGYQHYHVKCEAIKYLAQNGIDEVDVVTNIAAIKNKQWHFIEDEWKATIQMAKQNNLPIKIIIESGLMTKEELERLCDLANKLQPNFIKTSTGFNYVGAEIDKVIFLSKQLQSTIRIKASGGIKNEEQANAFIKAGASRIGTSSGVKIVTSQ